MVFKILPTCLVEKEWNHNSLYLGELLTFPLRNVDYNRKITGQEKIRMCLHKKN